MTFNHPLRAFLVALLLSGPILIDAQKVHGEASDVFNLRTNPMAWVSGPNLRVDTALSRNWTVGLAGSYVDRKLSSVDLRGQNGGVYTTYNLDGNFVSSWFADIGIKYAAYRATATPSSGQLEAIDVLNTSGEIVLGHHWFWQSFNIILGAGVAANSAGGQRIRDQSGNTVANVPINSVSATIDTSVGLSF